MQHQHDEENLEQRLMQTDDHTERARLIDEAYYYILGCAALWPVVVEDEEC